MPTISKSRSTILHAKPLTDWFVQFAIVLGLAAFADWLFFKQAGGVNFTLFLAALAGCSLASAIFQKNCCGKKRGLLVLLPGLIAGFEAFNSLTVLMGILGSVVFAIYVNTNRRAGFITWIFMVMRLTLTAPGRFIVDIIWLQRVMSKLNSSPWSSHAKGWMVPLVLTAGFLSLFYFANPLIGQWIRNFDILALLQLMDIRRLMFWVAIILASWPFIRLSTKLLPTLVVKKVKGTATKMPVKASGLMLDKKSVFRSLFLFNLLFGLQTSLDFIYLWGNHSLPDGVTYAQYVHRGTYILLLTSLLAATFILFVTGKKMAMETDRPIKILLLLWTTQNIVLVVSTMQRMGLYVEAFALTYLRVAALLWMLLVMIGLGFILVRLIFRHSNLWLIKMNAISLLIVCYATSLTNLPYVIADYNVTVALSDTSKKLDIHYLVGLGEDAIPVIDRVLESPYWRDNLVRTTAYNPHNLTSRRNRLSTLAKRNHRDWRQWSFRRQRLIDYLGHKNLDFGRFPYGQ